MRANPDTFASFAELGFKRLVPVVPVDAVVSANSTLAKRLGTRMMAYPKFAFGFWGLALTRLRAGDFVYPKLMAWEGAFGVVPPECEGIVPVR